MLVSTATAALVDGSELRDLGEHRLRDLSGPERIFQLGDDAFPPLKTLYRTNLPIPATPFLGREHELADVRALLARGEARLLTLTGAGGSGKTRLALRVAGEAAEAYPDGVWWVPLAPLADPADVGLAAARALGGGGTLPELVGGRRLLLLLDNFEHVVEAASMALNILSRAAFERGDPAQGLRLGYESAALANAVGFTWWHGITLVQAAEYLLASGDAAAAAEPLLAGLPSLAAVDDRVNLPIALAASAALASQHESAAQAGLLWGAVEAAAETEPRPTTVQALSDYEPYLDPVRGAAFDEARQRGRTLTVEDAINHALANVEP